MSHRCRNYHKILSYNVVTLSHDRSMVIIRLCPKIGHKMFWELTRCCEIILGPKIVIRLSYDRLWIGPQISMCCMTVYTCMFVCYCSCQTLCWRHVCTLTSLMLSKWVAVVKSLILFCLMSLLWAFHIQQLSFTV